MNVQNRAKAERNDEFYTSYDTILNEVMSYPQGTFRNKCVLCNCNDAYRNFWNVFKSHFTELGLKKLVATSYTGSYKLVYDGKVTMQKALQSGSFDSREGRKLLAEADIIVTNPPFSMFKQFISLVLNYHKQFLLIGNQNMCCSEPVFSYFKSGSIWYGITNTNNAVYEIPMQYNYLKNSWVKDGKQYTHLGMTVWYTNLSYPNIYHDYQFHYSVHNHRYYKYDNYDAINVDKIADIPVDYYGAIGVPITFLGRVSPKQFYILGHSSNLTIQGKKIYKRVIIKRKRGSI